MHYADLCRYLTPVQKSISSSSSFTLCNISLHYNFLSHQEQKSSRHSWIMMLSSDRQLPRFPAPVSSSIIRPTNSTKWSEHVLVLAALNLTAGHLDFSSLLFKTGPVFFSNSNFCLHEQVFLILIQSPCPHEPNLSWCGRLSGLLEYLTAVLYLDISPGSPQLDLSLSSPVLQRCDMLLRFPMQHSLDSFRKEVQTFLVFPEKESSLDICLPRGRKICETLNLDPECLFPCRAIWRTP